MTIMGREGNLSPDFYDDIIWKRIVMESEFMRDKMAD